MDKLIRDGQVAILYSAGFGAGWYSWHGVEELLYDPKIVKMLEDGSDDDAIMEYLDNKYNANEYYFGGVDGLTIHWLPVGTKFYIDEYDGAESVCTEDSIDWKVA